MSGHDLKPDRSQDWIAVCSKCGLIARVRFTPGNRLRLGTSVYAFDSNGRQVQPGQIPCKPRSEARRSDADV